MIQEFLVISPRGDTLITKSYSGAVNRTTTDTFLRRAKKDPKKAPPPIFQIDGVTFCHVQLNSMYFVFTTLKNVQAATLIELLQRLSRVFKVALPPTKMSCVG
jgi:AP-4 complex subunit mu-1